MRNDFEEWWYARYPGVSLMRHKRSGDYMDGRLNLAWKVWQAAWEMSKNDDH